MTLNSQNTHRLLRFSLLVLVFLGCNLTRMTVTPTAPLATTQPLPPTIPTAGVTAVDPVTLPATGEGYTPAPPASTAYISGITGNAAAIYQRGLTLGNRSTVFSKVGDSLTDGYHFLTPFGEGAYDLGAYSDLEATIAHFSATSIRGQNPFSTRSIAAQGGWISRYVLEPGWVPHHSAPDSCLPEELPLLCEYRTARPALALIMFGTNDLNFITHDEYVANMTHIVELSIEQGVIPVLFTIPDQNGHDEAVMRYNQTITRFARQFDVPLVDYWAASHNLPNRGLSADGIHPSAPESPSNAAAIFSEENLQYGFTVRNLLTLQALDMLRQNVLH